MAVLFKLQQMQKVDGGILDRLGRRFSELDLGQTGYLVIGTHVPSAAQVAQMQAATAGTGTTLRQAWRELRATLTASLLSDEEAARRDMERRMGAAKRVGAYHTFGWSRELWGRAAADVRRVALLCLLAYMALGYLLLCRLNGYDGVVAWYMLAATVSTVGYGDVAPNTQVTRGIAAVLIPCGLAILGLCISWTQAAQRARPPRATAAEETDADRRYNALFEALDADGGGTLDRAEVVAGCAILGMSPEEAGSWFDKVDAAGAGYLEKHGAALPFMDTIPGRMLVILAKVYVPIVLGAAAVLLLGWNLTAVDALYFATVTATSVGFGDVTPQSKATMWFLVFYMLASTVVVGGALGDFIDLFVNDVVGEGIVSTIIDSTTWLHKCDIYSTGKITEADYMLFKLQQMQLVDGDTLSRLVECFRAADVHGDGFLDIGVDVPSAKQVEQLQAQEAALKKSQQGSGRGGRLLTQASSIAELWDAERTELLRRRESQDTSPPEELGTPGVPSSGQGRGGEKGGAASGKSSKRPSSSGRQLPGDGGKVEMV